MKASCAVAADVIPSGPQFFACPATSRVTFDDGRPTRIFYENGDYVYEPGNEPTSKQQSFLWHQSVYGKPRVANVTSNEYHIKCLLALVAARQRAIDVSNGVGLRYVLSPDEGIWESAEVDDDYEGSPIVENDNRCRPLVWTKRHCRLYNDEYGSCTTTTYNELFGIVDIQSLKLPERMEYFDHYGCVPTEYDYHKPEMPRSVFRRSKKKSQTEEPPINVTVAGVASGGSHTTHKDYPYSGKDFHEILGEHLGILDSQKSIWYLHAAGESTLISA